MIEEQGTVVDVSEGRAWVETRRLSACSSCSAKGGCGSGMLSDYLGKRLSRFQALDAVGVQVGDAVVVGLPAASLVQGALVIYLLPLLGLLLLPLLLHWRWPQLAEPVSLLGAVLGFLAGLGLVHLFSRRVSDSPRFQPMILRRLPQPGLQPQVIEAYSLARFSAETLPNAPAGRPAANPDDNMTRE